MNKNINLCEILKGHENKTFYCSLLGDNVTLHIISDEHIYFYESNLKVNKYGQYFDGGECIIFPSKDQRDWNKWIKEQKPKIWSELPKFKSDLRKITDDFETLDMSMPAYKSALAFFKIYQLIEESYGGNVDNNEWNLTDIICPICHIGYNYKYDEFFIGRSLHSQHSPILFHTETQAEEFLSYPENVQLLKDYFIMI